MAFIPIYDTNPLVNISRPWVAWSLLAANIVVYFAVEVHGITGVPTHASVMSLGLIPAVFNGYAPSPSGLPDAATLVTYAFLHGDFWHLAGNMIFLWVLADNVEDALGHSRFLIFYLLCAIAGRLRLRTHRSGLGGAGDRRFGRDRRQHRRLPDAPPQAPRCGCWCSRASRSG